MRERHHLWAEGGSVTEPDVLLKRAQQLAQHYVESLARRAFAEVEMSVHHDLLRIPYTHVFMSCSRPLR